MILEIVCPLPIQRVFDYKLPASWTEKDPNNLIGRRVKISFGPRQAVGVIQKVKETSDAPLNKLKPATSLLDPEPLLTPDLMELGRWLAERYVCSQGEAFFSLMPAGRGKQVSFQGGESKVHLSDKPTWIHTNGIQLTPEQSDAVKLLHDATYDHAYKAYLIYGVAAAGKTEVYMRVIHDVLQKGQSALVLVPEIGLAIQTANVLKKRFGEDAVLLYHSDKKPKERLNDWWRIKRGEVPIVVGPRSAVLAPVLSLGVVVVDEEHDTAYKEDRKPRFHAREVALFRAQQHKALALLGSATPSLEMMEAGISGKAEMIEMKERAIRASAPQVRLIDVQKERFKGAVSITLQKQIEDRLKKKEQSILFINKRGFHRFLRCPNCEWVAKCPKCDIALIAHKEKSKEGKRDSFYLCHYCQYKTNSPSACPECRSKKLFAGGFGTQRIAEEVGQRFPWAKVLRWDRDAVDSRGGQQKIYDKFRSGPYDILVGTQMVAHGFNFPKVTLVGVIDADGPLYIPDFRAAEKTFQTVTQVAGRAGRAMVTGDVLIQTRNPDHYAHHHAQKMDYLGFANEELQFRREFNYPPYTHLVKVVSSSKKEKQAEKDMSDLFEWVSELNSKTAIGILGPTFAKRAKKGIKQFQLLFKVPKEIFTEFLREFRLYLSNKPSRFVVDVDPE